MGTDIADISSFPRMDRSVKARRFFGRTDIDTNDPLCARQRKGKKGREERTCCNGRRKMARCHPSLTCLLFYSQEKVTNAFIFELLLLLLLFLVKENNNDMI